MSPINEGTGKSKLNVLTLFQDNNPFSEEYQEREQRERVGCLPKPGPEPGKYLLIHQAIGCNISSFY